MFDGVLEILMLLHTMLRCFFWPFLDKDCARAKTPAEAEGRLNGTGRTYDYRDRSA
jgi:hypothetical protein